jgi:hypothetical protein
MAVATVEGDAHPSGNFMEERDTEFPVLVELSPLLVIEHGGHEFIQFGLGYGVGVGQNDFAIDAKGRRDSGNEVEVRSVELAGGPQQPVQVRVGTHNFVLKRL